MELFTRLKREVGESEVWRLASEGADRETCQKELLEKQVRVW